MQKTPFLRITTQNSPFQPLCKTDIFLKVHLLFVSFRKTNVSAVETFISVVGTKVSTWWNQGPKASNYMKL